MIKLLIQLLLSFKIFLNKINNNYKNYKNNS